MKIINRNRVKIAGRRITIEPMKAREGLEAVILLSAVLKDAIPFLAKLKDPSRQIRMVAIIFAFERAENLPDALFQVIYLSTGISQHVLETKATFAEVIEAMQVIIRINRWDDLWSTAYSLKIIDEESFVKWNISGLRRLRIR